MIGLILEIAFIVAIIALIFAVIRLHDRIEVLEAVIDRLDKESASAAKIAK